MSDEFEELLGAQTIPPSRDCVSDPPPDGKLVWISHGNCVRQGLIIGDIWYKYEDNEVTIVRPLKWRHIRKEAKP